MLKYISKFIELLLNLLIVVLFVIIGIFGFSVIDRKVSNKLYSDVFGYTVFEVQTGSMSGSIEVGDIVIVKVIDEPDLIETGDVISFVEDNMIITHRVIVEGQDYFVTKGDANNTDDGKISKDSLIGKVEKIIPKVGLVKKAMLTKKSLILITITVICIFISTSSSKEDNENKEENIDEKNDKK